MANVYAVKSGNWSDVTVWNTGALPAAVDDVRPNGFTVAIDQNITVTTLRNDVLSPAAAGGSFACNRNGTTINANIQVGTTTVINNATTAISWTVNGNITPSTSINSSGINMTPASNLTITGNVQGGLSGGASYSYGIYGLASTVTCIGNVTGGNNTASGANSHGINCNILNLTGNATSGANICGAVAATTLTMVGNAFGTGASAPAVNGTTVSFTGTTTGGSGTGGGLSATTLTGTLTAIGGIGASGYGLIVGAGATTVGATITAQGSATLGGAAGVFGNNTSTTLISEAVYTDCAPTAGKVRFKNINPRITVIKLNGSSQVLVEAGASGDFPVQTDVRSGVTYANNTLTGSLIVPNPSNVRKGVPTDATVGTADLTAADFWNALTSTMTTSGSIGERLKNASTVQTTGDQLASYIV